MEDANGNPKFNDNGVAVLDSLTTFAKDGSSSSYRYNSGTTGPKWLLASTISINSKTGEMSGTNYNTSAETNWTPKVTGHTGYNKFGQAIYSTTIKDDGTEYCSSIMTYNGAKLVSVFNFDDSTTTFYDNYGNAKYSAKWTNSVCPDASVQAQANAINAKLKGASTPEYISTNTSNTAFNSANEAAITAGMGKVQNNALYSSCEIVLLDAQGNEISSVNLKTWEDVNNYRTSLNNGGSYSSVDAIQVNYVKTDGSTETGPRMNF